MRSKNIVFIHGMFMNSLCWENWLKYFNVKGYKCIAPNWPGREGSAESLRKKHPDAELGKLTLSRVIKHYAGIVGMFQDKPVIIGHSMGGLVAQILINRGLGSAGVAIDPAPPSGVFTAAWPFLKSNFPMINPFIPASRPHLMTLKQFQYAFVNDMPLTEQKKAYEKYVLPESRRVPRESLGMAGRIDFKKEHVPLLLTAGSIDHIIPSSLNKKNFMRYKTKSSVTDFKEFPGRNHFGIGQKNWKEMADFILSWLKEKKI